MTPLRTRLIALYGMLILANAAAGVWGSLRPEPYGAVTGSNEA